MIQWVKEAFLQQSGYQAIIVISLVSCIGLLLNKLSLKGITLGVAFVFFVGIFFASLGIVVDPKILKFLGDFGLIIFIYSLGLLVGPGFFNIFLKYGIKLNLWAMAIVLISTALAIAMGFMFNEPIADMLGVLCGATTNTPALAAVQQTFNQLHVNAQTSAIATAVTYPLGVAGVIFSIIILKNIFNKRIEKEGSFDKNKKVANLFEITISNPNIDGKTIKELAKNTIPYRFIIYRIWDKNGNNVIPQSDTVIHEGDVIHAAFEDKAISYIPSILGKAHSINWEDEEWKSNPVSNDSSWGMVLVSRPFINGRTISSLRIRENFHITITKIFRSDFELLPSSDLILQLGDKLIVVGDEKSIAELKDFMGDKEAKLLEPNLVAVFIGIFIGVLFGSVPFYIPGISFPIKLGLAGGPIIIGILMGAFGARIRLATYVTRSANLMLQRLGLTIYLACLGLASGSSFIASIVDGNGLWWILMGAFITIFPTLLVSFIMMRFSKIKFETVAGLVCGSMSNPMALNYMDTQYSSNQSSIAYAAVYPLSMFARVIIAQLIPILFLT